MFWRGDASLVGQQILQTVMRGRISPCDGAQPFHFDHPCSLIAVSAILRPW